MFWGVGQLHGATVRNSFAHRCCQIGGRADTVRGKPDRSATQSWRQRLRKFMTRKWTRDDKQEPKVLTKRMLANKHHLLTGDQALARFCPQVRLAGLTEHEERHTVAIESLPADLRKTMPAYDMRSCILNRETMRTRPVEHDAGLPFQSFGHGQHRLGGETFRVPGHWLPKVGGAIFECFWCAQTTHVVCAHAGTQSFFLRRGAHVCVARALRPSCTVVKRERLAIPTRTAIGARHTTCGGAS